MGAWDAEQADLIYLDPPFNSNQDYNVLYGHDAKLGRTAQRRAFGDTWRWDATAEQRLQDMKRLGPANPLRDLAVGLNILIPSGGMLAYVTYMAERLAECHRLLKETGSLYLHCDDNAVHYLKIVLDCLFGAKNFVNHIVWRRATAHNDAKRFGRICDHMLFYAKNVNRRYWDGKNKGSGRVRYQANSCHR